MKSAKDQAREYVQKLELDKGTFLTPTLFGRKYQVTWSGCLHNGLWSNGWRARVALKVFPLPIIIEWRKNSV